MRFKKLNFLAEEYLLEAKHDKRYIYHAMIDIENNGKVTKCSYQVASDDYHTFINYLKTLENNDTIHAIQIDVLKYDEKSKESKFPTEYAFLINRGFSGIKIRELPSKYRKTSDQNALDGRSLLDIWKTDRISSPHANTIKIINENKESIIIYKFINNTKILAKV